MKRTKKHFLLREDSQLLRGEEGQKNKKDRRGLPRLPQSYDQLRPGPAPPDGGKGWGRKNDENPSTKKRSPGKQKRSRRSNAENIYLWERGRAKRGEGNEAGQGKKKSAYSEQGLEGGGRRREKAEKAKITVLDSRTKKEGHCRLLTQKEKKSRCIGLNFRGLMVGPTRRKPGKKYKVRMSDKTARSPRC